MQNGQNMLSCLMLRPPLAKVSKSSKTLLIMLLIFLITFALLVLFIYIRKALHSKLLKGVHSYFVIANASLAVMTIALLSIVTLSNPGRITPKVPFLQLLENFDATQLCAECKTLKTIRSRHCTVCH